MGINSRSKGNKAERIAAKVISDWTGKKFGRVPSSGGLQWKNSHAKGDIVCTEEGHFFPFCLEVKNYREINFEHLLYLDKPQIVEFWDQCVRDAEIARKCPMLMMRYDRLPKEFFFVVLPDEVMPLLNKYIAADSKILRVSHLKVTIIVSTTLLSIPYKKIRKPVKKQYRNE